MGSKIDINFEGRKQLNASRLTFSGLSGVEVGSKTRPKVAPKMESKMECILVSILITLVDFWYQVEVENGAKINQKWHRKND